MPKPAVVADAGHVGDVREVTVVVAKETAVSGLSILRVLRRAEIDDVQIEVSITVIVAPRQTRAGVFGQNALTRTGPVSHDDSQLRGHVTKSNRRRPSMRASRSPAVIPTVAVVQVRVPRGLNPQRQLRECGSTHDGCRRPRARSCACAIDTLGETGANAWVPRSHE